MHAVAKRRGADQAEGGGLPRAQPKWGEELVFRGMHYIRDINFTIKFNNSKC